MGLNARGLSGKTVVPVGAGGGKGQVQRVRMYSTDVLRMVPGEVHLARGNADSIPTLLASRGPAPQRLPEFKYLYIRYCRYCNLR